MTNPFFDIIEVDHLQWELVADTGDARNVVLRFLDSNQRLLLRELRIDRFRMSEWHFQERLYDRCDQVRVLDQNLDGAQLEYGRFVVEFVRGGQVVGRHVADSVAVRRCV